MLAGILGNERIIAGAYVDGQGGVCPMLAAHRCGARTDFLSFARSWDRVARVTGDARQASERELGILVRQLEASLAEDDGGAFDVAIAEHRALVTRARRDHAALAREADPRGTIIARRLRRRGQTQIASPGRMNTISGTRHAGEALTR